jgi:hypothetical protein
MTSTDNSFLDHVFRQNDYSTLDPLDNLKPLKSVCFEIERRAPTTGGLQQRMKISKDITDSLKKKDSEGNIIPNEPKRSKAFRNVNRSV